MRNLKNLLLRYFEFSDNRLENFLKIILVCCPLITIIAVVIHRIIFRSKLTFPYQDILMVVMIVCSLGLIMIRIGRRLRGEPENESLLWGPSIRFRPGYALQ